MEKRESSVSLKEYIERKRGENFRGGSDHKDGENSGLFQQKGGVFYKAGGEGKDKIEPMERNNMPGGGVIQWKSGREASWEPKGGVSIRVIEMTWGRRLEAVCAAEKRGLGGGHHEWRGREASSLV